MKLIKRELTPLGVEKVRTSLKIMAIMAKVIQMEYYTEMDVKFKNPQVNQFANRIFNDVKAIEFHLKHHKDASIDFVDQQLGEEIAGELHRVIHFFIHLPLSQIKEVMDNLDKVVEMEQTA